MVLADEIYGEILYEGEHVSIATLPGMAERTIMLDGFSQDLRDDRLAARLRDRCRSRCWRRSSRLMINSVSCTATVSQRRRPSRR